MSDLNSATKGVASSGKRSRCKSQMIELNRDWFRFLSGLTIVLLCSYLTGCGASATAIEESKTEGPLQSANPPRDDHDDILAAKVVGPAPLSTLPEPIPEQLSAPEPSAELVPDTVPLPPEKPLSPVARQIVENYRNSKNKEPGGHCLSVSKSRFERAYREIHNHSFYQDLPESIASEYYTPSEVFDQLYATTSGRHQGWRTLPKEYRGRGGPGALAYAGMGTLVDWFGIWSGELRPGALMQVWKRREDYKKVIRGSSEKNFDPFGHSFIFLGYERDESGKITGMRIADQGYQSYRPLVPRDYDIWWAVNLSI